jgi:hypothetical protein
VRRISDIMNSSALSRVEDEALPNAAADELMQLMINTDIFMIDPRQRARLQQLAGAALANRFVFACLDDNPAEERRVWVFTPLAVWAKTGQMFDLPCPIGHLLPPGAEEISEGVWIWEDAKDKTDRALNLMARGFIWDRAFQERIDGSQHALIATMERLQKPRPAPRP